MVLNGLSTKPVLGMSDSSGSLQVSCNCWGKPNVCIANSGAKAMLTNMMCDRRYTWTSVFIARAVPGTTRAATIIMGLRGSGAASCAIERWRGILCHRRQLPHTPRQSQQIEPYLPEPVAELRNLTGLRCHAGDNGM